VAASGPAAVDGVLAGRFWLLNALAFLFVESRTAHPILPLSLLGRRRVWTMFLVTTLGGLRPRSQHDHVVQGTAFYADGSYRNALWLFAAVAVVAALLSVLIPKVGRIIGDADAGAGPDEAADALTV
jgi:hypothetical protein